MSTSKSRFFATSLLASTLALPILQSSSADASPVLYAGSGEEKVHSTDVVLMLKDGQSVMTIMPDYEGPLENFAVIVPVPKGTGRSSFATIKRQYVSRVAKVSAPRFAEFWEMDPCESGKAEQEWERDLTAKSSSAFLGEVKTEPGERVAKEMLLELEAETKDGEYQVGYSGGASGLLAWLAKQEYKLPSGGQEAIESYAEQGYDFIALDVDADMLELMGADRAQLSPMRFAFNEEVTKIPARFGLPSGAKQEEINIFTMAVGQRMQVKNYETLAAPTNLRVDFKVKERMGEYYAALHDLFLKKHPETFLLEYAYTTADCTKPCPTEPLLPGELLTLGGDVFEKKVPQSERDPAPPEMTEEEEAKLASQTTGKPPQVQKELKKDFETARRELARRRALIARNEFVLTRLHYRYAADSLPKDIELGPGGAVAGGQALPMGAEGAAKTAVEGAEKNAFQTRFNSLHENIKVVECEQPERYRWGKPPRSYRGANKIWVADDLSRRDRSMIQPAEVTFTSISDLGIAGKSMKKEEEKPVAVEPKKEEGICSYASGPSSRLGWLGALALSLVGALGLSRRKLS